MFCYIFNLLTMKKEDLQSVSISIQLRPKCIDLEELEYVSGYSLSENFTMDELKEYIKDHIALGDVYEDLEVIIEF